MPRGTGIHAFNLQIGECTRGKHFLNNKVVLDLNNRPSGTTQLKLQGGRPVKVRVDFQNPESAAGVQLEWSAPGDGAPDPKQTVDRARNDGTTVIVADCTENWMPCLVASGLVECNEKLPVKINWVGGQYFVREGNPLFKDLPDGVMSCPYESVIQPGRNEMAGEKTGAGTRHACLDVSG